MGPRGRSSPTQLSASLSRRLAPRRRPRASRRSPCPAAPALFASCPASAGPASASSSDPSFRDLLHARHPSVEPAHNLADEWIVLGTHHLCTRLRDLTLAKPEVDLDLVAQPFANVRHQLHRLLPGFLVMKPVAGPQAPDPSIDLGPGREEAAG